MFTLLFRWSGQDQKRLRFSFALSAALFGWLNYTSSVWLYPTAQCLLMACGSMAGIAASGFVILYLYNGQRAARGKNFSHWFFYLFYPVLLLVLGVIRVMGCWCAVDFYRYTFRGTMQASSPTNKLQRLPR